MKICAPICLDLSEPELSAETLADCVERCQQARIQVDSNANQSTLIECWIDDLSQLMLGAWFATRHRVVICKVV